MDEYIVYALLSALVVGLHLFSLKLLSLYEDYVMPLLAFAIATMLASRFLIYTAMRKTDNPTNVHLVLNLSIFVTLAASMLFLPIHEFHVTYYVGGVVCMLFGLYLVQLSYAK